MRRSSTAALRMAVLLLGALACSALAKNINTFAGPYITYGKVFYVCGEGCDGTWARKIRVSHLNPAKPNELQRISGFVNVGRNTGGLHDGLWSKVTLDKRSNNQWKENAFVFNLPTACSTEREHIPDVFRVFFGTKNLSGRCHVPPGNYTFSDEPVKWIFPHFPVVPYGEYRFRLAVHNHTARVNIVCLCAEAIIMPKI